MQIRLELDLGVASVQPGDDAPSAIARAKDELEAAVAAESDESQAESRRLAGAVDKLVEQPAI